MRTLVVDDDRIAAEIASAALRAGGFEVETVFGGDEAWKRVSARSAEIVVTDWMMPAVDGLELCRRIRAMDPEPYVYVLLVTGRDEVSDVVRGLDAGADDFLRKPFVPEELVARVSAIRRMKALHDRIAEQNRQLKQSNDLRRDWTNMIVHDLRSPLTVIQGSAEILHMNAQPQQRKSLERIRREARRVHAMLEQMLVMAKSDAGQLRLVLEECDLRALVAEVVDATIVGAGGKRVRVLLDPSSQEIRASIDRALWRRMLENLVGNGVKFTPDGGSVSVRVGRSDEDVVLTVTDDGPGVTPEDRERIFGSFETVPSESAVLQHGLGLAFCKLVVDAHGGAIVCRPALPHGSCFEVRHPALSAAPVLSRT